LAGLSSVEQESQKKGSTATHGSTGNPVKNYVLTQLAKLMTTCVILRIQDFTLYQVTTSKRKQMPKEFITGKIATTNILVCWGSVFNNYN
jgi:hypothetical protein